MQERFKIDRDTRTLILKYIRKYDEYLTWYKSERDRITSPPREVLRISESRSSDVKDSTLTAVEALERLDSSHRTLVIKAIDGARNKIGADIESEKELLAMQRAIWLSCLNAYEYNFETFAGTVCCERRQFYKYKNEFLNDIKLGLGL